MQVLTCETVVVKTYQALSLKAFWTSEARTALLCGCQVRLINPDSHCVAGAGEPLFFEVAGTPQQVSRFEADSAT